MANLARNTNHAAQTKTTRTTGRRLSLILCCFSFSFVLSQHGLRRRRAGGPPAVEHLGELSAWPHWALQAPSAPSHSGPREALPAETGHHQPAVACVRFHFPLRWVRMPSKLPVVLFSLVILCPITRAPTLLNCVVNPQPAGVCFRPRACRRPSLSGPCVASVSPAIVVDGCSGFCVCFVLSTGSADNSSTGPHRCLGSRRAALLPGVYSAHHLWRSWRGDWGWDYDQLPHFD